LAVLAGRHGVVTRERLLAAGFGRNQIARLVGNGTLIPVHRGVYVVVHASSPLAHECAAVLACRPRAVLSHRTAGSLWQLPVDRGDAIEVTVVGRRPWGPNGIKVHHIDQLAGHELRRRQGIPIAGPSLTLLDLAGVLARSALATALNEARVQRQVTDSQLRATLAAHPKRRGAKALRALLDSERGPRITRSEAERRALELMRANGIEPDETDHRIGPYRVDFLFRSAWLIVEVDGYRYHGTRYRFVRDRRRTAALGALGYQVHPLTWDDIENRPAVAMRDLKLALEQRRA
jgi:very-short-patch-repair endonuclease